ncbi:hypothetical protein K7640_04935 [Micromonospora sp. PLK6-60]|uniref:hypothetical protein n=1 Tax=Micromonospora sp. PLK6-60 TaxID=2873383 RepID=UPI001CA6D1A0|nr:hypothetical protein [Micromonospora sp. PLK6-60]MBY8871190.1 hypothetical protein [Micromonospora sp. PLK6-60]
MARSRRHGTTATLLALLLAVAGCGPVADLKADSLPVGYDSLDGKLKVWPPRGTLAGDPAATAAVTEAVRAWRSPEDDRAHLPSSGILWSGEVDGGPVALVAADVPGDGASWLLQLTRDGDRYAVHRASEYTDPGYLVYSDVLPVQSAEGRRYLTSGRVERLRGPDGRDLAVTDGLSAPVRVPACRAVTVTATLRPTESLPRGRAADRLLDLGTATTDPRYPLVRDETGAGQRALAGLDTCLLAGEDGPFGSIPRRIGDRYAPKSVPESWPMEALTVRPLGPVAPDGRKPGQLSQLTWKSDHGEMTAVLYRPAGGGPPVFSRADRSNPLQAYVLPVPEHPLVVLTWRAGPDAPLAVPPGTPRLVDRPGLVVVPQAANKQTFSLTSPDKTYQRSVGGR